MNEEFTLDEICRKLRTICKEEEEKASKKTHKDKLHQELMELKDIFNMADFGFKSEKENIEKELRKTHKCPKCGYEW